MAFTKVTGPGIHTLSNIISHNIDSSGIITATKFVGTVEGPITGDLVTNDWITHEGDPDTRIGFPDPNKVEMQAAGKTALHVNTAGLVGINTNSPTAAHLDIATTGGTYDNLRLRRTSSGAGDSNWSLKPYAGHLYFRQGGSTDKIVFESGGKIGLNTMTVGDTLHIHQLNANHGIKLERGGATNPGSTTIQVHSYGALSVTSSNNITHTSGGSNQHVWMQGTNEAMRIDENRRLGIGTGNPSVKLHVYDGSIRSSNTEQTNFTELGSDGNIEIKRTGGSAYIDFADATGNDADCRIQHVSDGFEFSTGGQDSRTTKLSITSGGQVGICTQTIPSDAAVHIGLDGAREYLRLDADDGNTNAYIEIQADDNRRKAIIFKSGGTRRGVIGVGDSDEATATSLFFSASANIAGNSPHMVITSDGFIGINKDDPQTGLTIAKYGTQPVVNGNTYPYPAGNWSTVWNATTANSTDYWAGFAGGYNVSSATVNIALQPNIWNFSTQQGIYIAGEAQSTSSADFTVGKLIGGSQGGASASAGNQRATKDELFRITSAGKVGIGTHTIDRDLEVYNSGGQTAIGIEGGTNTSQCSLWFMKPGDGNIGGIYYLHGSDDTQGFHFRANDQQVANIKGSGILKVENNITGAGHTAGVHIFKSSGSNDDHAELAVGYDRQNCYVIKRKRNSGTIQLNATQSGAQVHHEYMGTARWIEYSAGLIGTHPGGGGNFNGRWRYTQLSNQVQNYEYKILGPDGTSLKTYTDNNVHGIIWVGIVGTGTPNAYCQYRFSNRSAENNLTLTHIAGGSSGNSNIPYMVNDGNNCPAWKMDHSGDYNTVIDVMVIGGKSSNGTYTAYSYTANP